MKVSKEIMKGTPPRGARRGEDEGEREKKNGKERKGRKEEKEEHNSFAGCHQQQSNYKSRPPRAETQTNTRRRTSESCRRV